MGWHIQLTDFFHSQVFILENDIYYQASVSSPAKRITSSGHQVVIFNGISDWLYEGDKTGEGGAVWKLLEALRQL